MDDDRFLDFPRYIFGLNDLGGEGQMLAALKPGWVVVDVSLNPANSKGDFTQLKENGLGVMVRLRNGPLGEGSLPNWSGYDQFARDCAEFVRTSSGARVWIIGNEPNVSAERPGYSGSGKSGQVITPALYADCFNRCRQAIHQLPSHEDDWVVPAAVGTFNSDTIYPSNAVGDWVRYFADMLFEINNRGGRPDALALHVYTHSYDPELIRTEARAMGRLARHWHFRAYRDFLSAVPPAWRKLPVLITKAQPLEPGWTNSNCSWIGSACAEIDEWNSDPAHQPIQAICFSRWQHIPSDPPEASIADKPQVIEDWCAALLNSYRVRWPGTTQTPDYDARWLGSPQLNRVTTTTDEFTGGRLIVKNSGAIAWTGGGDTRVSLLSSWRDAEGVEAYSQLIGLRRTVLPGQTAIIDDFYRSPPTPGTYRLRFDLYREGKALSLPSAELQVTVRPREYCVEWLGPLAFSQTLEPNEPIDVSVVLQNKGKASWNAGGENPVRLVCQWLDTNKRAIQSTRFPLPRDVRPNESVTIEHIKQNAPIPKGRYLVAFDLLKEGVTWAHAPGSAPRVFTVKVEKEGLEDAAEWVEVLTVPKGTIRAGKVIRGDVTVRNVGSSSWNGDVRLGYRWYDSKGNEQVASVDWVSVDSEILPRETTVFRNFEIRAPEIPGRYTLKLDLSRAGGDGFSSGGSQAATAVVNVRPEPPDWGAEITAHDIPPHQVSREAVPVKLRLQNAGVKSWESDGSAAVVAKFKWVDAQSQPLTEVEEGSVTIASNVASGDSIEVTTAVTAPSSPGSYRLQWYVSPSAAGGGTEAQKPLLEIPIRVSADGTPAHLWRAESSSNATEAFLAVDGNLGSFWSSQSPQSIGMWFRVTFPDPRTIDGIAFRSLGDGSPFGYKLLLSTDGNSWMQVSSVEEGNTDDVVATFSPFQVKGAQVELLAECKYYWEIADVQIHSNSPWEASASVNGDFAGLALDNDPETAWSTLPEMQAADIWFQLDLGRTETIEGLALESKDSENPCNFAVSAWDDHLGAWRKLAGRNNNTAPVNLRFAPVETRYIQIQLAGGASTPWSIRDLRVDRALAEWTSPA